MYKFANIQSTTDNADVLTVAPRKLNKNSDLRAKTAKSKREMTGNATLCV